MTVSQRVIEILNADEKAVKLSKVFYEAAERQGLTEEEITGAREAFMMMLIQNNKEAMSVMAQELYKELKELD